MVPDASLSNRSLAVWAVVLAFLALCFRLGALPLLAPDEGRNAEIAREMRESGAWLVPTYNGVPYLDKPAFYFKVVALSLAALGRNETAARLPSALFAFALVAMVFAFGRKVYNARAGLVAAIVVATNPLFIASARIVIFDMALAFFVCGAVFCGFLAEESQGRSRWNWYLLAAAGSGLATLVKGPVGFLIPALVMLVFVKAEGRRGAWKRLFAPVNVAVFLGIALPWFVALCVARPDFLHYGLVEETFNRFTTSSKFDRSEPFYFFAFIVAVAFFPWSLLLPEASWGAWRQRWARHPADRLAITWCAVVVVFFSLSQSKLPHYILSVTVAFGLLAGRLIDAALADPGGRAARLVLRATMVFGLMSLGVGVAALVAQDAAMRALARPLRVSPADAERLAQAFVVPALLLVGFGAWALLAWLRRSVALSFLSLALFLPLFGNSGLGAAEVVFNAKSGRQVAASLSRLDPGSELACLECFPNGLSFYLNRTATLISRNGAELTSHYIISLLERTAPWPPQIVPLAQLESWLASRQTPVYLIACDWDRPRLDAIAQARGGLVEQLSPKFVGVQLPAPGKD